MLIAKDLYKSYGAIEVLRGVNLSLKSGQVATLVGKSGAGKSTLLQILGTLDTPDRGELLFEERDATRWNAAQRARFRNEKLGFVFQFHHLLPEFSALENVCMPALIKGDSKRAATEKAKQLLEYLKVSHRLNHKPSELSGGEQQRVAVARALINEPLLILADEPTGNLDSSNRNSMVDLFLKLAEDRSVSFLVATHDEEVAKTAHRCIRIDDGKIVS